VPYEEKIVERYKAVFALAEQGVGGEKDNALRIRAKMEQMYPGIREQAFPPPPQDEGFDPFRRWRTQQAPEPEPEQESRQRRQQQQRPGGWEDFFGGFAGNPQGQAQGRKWQETAQDVLGWAAKVAQEMSSLGTARAYAENITELQAKMLQSGKWQIAVKFPLRDLYAVAGNMNEAQRQEFARYVASMVEAEVLAALEEGA
jgi:hypothetical protein